MSVIRLGGDTIPTMRSIRVYNHEKRRGGSNYLEKRDRRLESRYSVVTILDTTLRHSIKGALGFKSCIDDG